MRHLRISKRVRRSLVGFISFLIVGILLLEGIGLRPIFFLQRGFAGAGAFFGKTVSYLRTYDEFYQELSVLRERVIFLSLTTLEAERLRRENDELRSLLSFVREDGAPYAIIPAQVIARSLDEERAEFVINKGTRDGLSEGLAVVVEDGILVGTIERARERFSTVRLLMDHRSRIASKILGSGTIGVSEGAKGLLLEFGFIPRHVKLEVNDLVFTSGLESDIPEGLVIGFITVVSTDDTQPFQQATIEPLVDARLYQTVGVIGRPLSL